MAETGRTNLYMTYRSKLEINSPVRHSEFALLKCLSLELTTVFQEVRHVHQGKDSSSHRCSHRHWSGMCQGAPKERGTGQLDWLIILSRKGSG